jgi:hypothetical protein
MFTKNSVEKAMPAKQEAEAIANEIRRMKQASESEAEELELQVPMDKEYDKGLKDFLKNNPEKNERDYQIEVIGIDLAALSRRSLIDMLKNEYPREYKLLEQNIDKYPTKEIKKILDNLDGKDRVPFNSGGSSNGVSSMKKSDFLKLPFKDRVEKMFGVTLKGDEKLSEIQIKINGLEPMLILEE